MYKKTIKRGIKNYNQWYPVLTNLETSLASKTLISLAVFL